MDCCSSGTMFDLPLEAPSDRQVQVAMKLAIQRGHAKRSWTMPSIGVSHAGNQKSPFFLPRMKSRSVSCPGEPIVMEPGLVDNRVILADVTCISSCADSKQTFETHGGGVLIEAFCLVMSHYRSLHLRDLKQSLTEDLRKQHEFAKATTKDWNPQWEASVPQFSFSRNYVCPSRVQEADDFDWDEEFKLNRAHSTL